MAIYLDTIKLFGYLFLGILVSFGFWNVNEIFFQRYFKKKISPVDPFLFLITGILGSSGFFFLSPTLHVLPVIFHPFLRLLCTAVPDWDILFYIWAHSWFSGMKSKMLYEIEWRIFIHRSWLFSSSIIPTLVILSGYRIPKFPYSFLSNIKKAQLRLNAVFIMGAGLSVGISAHLLGDVIWQFLPGGDGELIIYRLNQQNSLIWIISHIFLGLLVPFLCIWLENRHLRMIDRGRRVQL